MFAPIVLLLVVVIYRVAFATPLSSDLSWMQNFAPLTALALCGATCLPRRIAWVLPMGILLISDLLLNAFVYHVPLLTLEIVPRYLVLAAVTALGCFLRGKVRLPGLLGAALVSSLLFYVVTNTGSWLGEPAYSKTFAGWIQALTVGLPGYPSTFLFYRQTLASDLIFTLLFSACMALSAHRASAPLVAAPAR
ncbi:MAG: hypothetical protein JWL90_2373 [Chthoniobacteraceae bacterium]|nr:hypothetical protein [Chthoniobacteraceae bacterium]